MNSSNFNPRMTIVVVFAFLFIVALFMRPGGAAEQATGQLTETARAVAAKRPVPAPSPTPSSWFAASPEGPSPASPTPPVVEPQPAPPPGTISLVPPEPPFEHG